MTPFAVHATSHTTQVENVENTGGTTMKNLIVIGVADGIGMGLVKHVFGKTPDIGRITLADVKPLYRPGFQGAANPDGKHVEELAHITKSLDAVRCENGNEVAEWAVVDTAAEAPAEALALDDYGLVMLSEPDAQIEDVASGILPSLRPGTAVFDTGGFNGQSGRILFSEVLQIEVTP